MSRQRLLVVFVIVFIHSCTLFPDESETVPVRLRTDRSFNAIGDSMNVTVTNYSERTLFFATCCGPFFPGVERLERGTWQRLPGTCLALCISLPKRIPPGGSGAVRDSFQPVIDRPGTYRLTIQYWREAEAARAPSLAVSPSFLVDE